MNPLRPVTYHPTYHTTASLTSRNSPFVKLFLPTVAVSYYFYGTIKREIAPLTPSYDDPIRLAFLARK